MGYFARQIDFYFIIYISWLSHKRGIKMKLEIFAQANGNEMNLTDLEKSVKEQIKAAGLKLTKVDNAKAYVNLDDGKTYVVVETEGKEVAL